MFSRSDPVHTHSDIIEQMMITVSVQGEYLHDSHIRSSDHQIIRASSVSTSALILD